MRIASRIILGSLLAITTLTACDRMANQSKQLPYEVYAAQQSDNPDFTPVEGTVGRDQVPPPAPPPVTLALLKRGQERFDIYCAVCHGRTGLGDGVVVQRGFPPPPSYTTPRLVAAPSQHFYDVITNGYGAMYSYADRVAPTDRWSIVAYIRALQISQHTAFADVPAAERELLP